MTDADEVDRIVDDWERERPDLDFAPLQVLSRVARLAKHLDRARREAFARSELEASEFDVLSALRRAGAPYRLFSSALRPGIVDISTANGRTGAGPFDMELGVKIQVTEPETVNAIRYYRSPGETGQHTARLWTPTGLMWGRRL